MDVQSRPPPALQILPPSPFSDRIGKTEKQAGREASDVRKQIPCYICMTILLYFSEQTSVVYVPVCPDSLAPLPAAPPPRSHSPSVVI